MGFAADSSFASSSSTPRIALPTRPEAFRRGARMNPTLPDVIGLRSSPAARIIARNPTFFVSLSSRRP